MIEVQHVTKQYGPVTAVNDVSFRVESGQILGFLGPNGAGKTTTMRILTGCIPATEGKAAVAGFDVFEQAVEAKRRTGYLPETPPLYPDMTIREYLNFVARINGIRSGDRRDRVGSAMVRTSTEDVADRHCGKLSKGYRQRVGLAQAILHNPDVLILDEPTAGLDPKQIIETRELIKSLAGDHTIILSTHILAGSGPDLPAGGHHQQRSCCRRGHAPESHRAAARVTDDPAGNRRAWDRPDSRVAGRGWRDAGDGQPVERRQPGVGGAE